MLAAILVAAMPILLVLHGGRVQRRSIERDLRDRLSDAAHMIADGVVDHTQLVGTYLLAPVVGARPAPGSGSAPARVRLEALGADPGGRHLPWGLREDPMLGFFRFPVGAGSAAGAADARPSAADVETGGATADGRLLHAILADLDPRFWRRDSRNEALRAGLVRVGGRDVTYLIACERAADGTPLAVVGVTFTRELEARRALDRLLASQPLLPAAFAGLDWRTARALAGGPAASGAPVLEPDAGLNAMLLVEVTNARAEPIRRTPADPTAWETPYVGEAAVKPGYQLQVRVAFPRAEGDRLVAAVAARDGQRWLLAGTALISAAFVGAVLVEVRRQRQLAEARRAFVSAISHELRTPLTHIGTLSETLLVGGATDAAQERRWLAAIHREAHRLGRMAENVMLHARGERATIPLDRSWTRLGAVVDDVLARADAMARARDVRLVARVPDDATAHVDGGAMRQVLLNLVDNAIKYGPEGQQVTLTVCAPTAGQPALRLVVDDEGPGVAMRDRRRIWAAFERVGDRGGATGGSGLGLSVVQALVHAHRGRTWVDDAPGGGARFVIELPQPGRPADRASA